MARWTEFVKTGKDERLGTSLRVLPLLLVFCLAVVSRTSAASEGVEGTMAAFIKQFYGTNKDIQVKMVNLPASLQQTTKVAAISFSKVPDHNGDGQCLLDVTDRNGRARSMYVAFKVLSKRKLFVLKDDGKAGDLVKERDVVVRETYLNGGGNFYPTDLDDVVGKNLRKDIAAGAVLTNQMLEDRPVLKKGDVVTILASNDRLVVQTKGRTMEKGKVGETIRVKNIASGKEIVGRILNSSTITVHF